MIGACTKLIAVEVVSTGQIGHMFLKLEATGFFFFEIWM